MTRQDIFQYVLEKYDTKPEYPWPKYPGNVIFRNTNDKWYGIIMDVRADKLGMEGPDTVDVLNVKCDPVLIGTLRQRKYFLPAYHMNKENWISIIIESSISDDEIRNLIDMSHELTSGK